MQLALWFGPTTGKFHLVFTAIGLLGGLVAITFSCYWISPLGAIIIGAIAGLVVFIATNLMEYLRIYDPIGTMPVHGACGNMGP